MKLKHLGIDEEKRCPKCKKTLPINAFYYPKDSWCKLCQNEKEKRRYYKNLEFSRKRHRECKKVSRAKNPELARARDKERYHKSREKKVSYSQVFYAIKHLGLKKPSTCSECGVSTKLEGHHKDYSKPLGVVWLCSKCHKEIHRKDYGWTQKS